MENILSFVNAEFMDIGHFRTPEGEKIDMAKIIEENEQEVQSAKLCRQKETGQSRCPVRPKKKNLVGPNGWEIISAIVDSGATVAVLHPEDGK